MNTNDFCGMWERIELSAEADDRIRRAIEAACSERETEVISMRSAKNIRRRAPKTAVAALAAAAVLTVAALAIAVSRINVDIQRFRGGESLDTPTAEPYSVEIDFQTVDGAYIGLGTWYPAEIPDGYVETFVSDAAAGQGQRVVFENGAGKCFDMVVRTAGLGAQFGVSDVITESEVTINGETGVLYATASGGQVVVWADDARGIGFVMSTDDEQLDLAAIAQSVTELDTPLTPTNATEYGAAIEQLGDYRITAPPEGYGETGMTAAPIPTGGWYGYVNRYYENSAHERLYFEYETFALSPDVPQTAETVIDYYGGGSPVTVNGLPGGQSDGRIVWVDMERALVFAMTADALAADELFAAADSVALR